MTIHAGKGRATDRKEVETGTGNRGVETGTGGSLGKSEEEHRIHRGKGGPEKDGFGSATNKNPMRSRHRDNTP